MDARQHRSAPRFVALALLLLLAACAAPAGPPAPNFTLRDDRGTAWSLSDQRGKVVLLDFGFTHCADTCPTTIAKLVKLTGALGSQGNDVRIAFVTVDPRRDTVPVMHAFIERFDGGDRLVGLTGTAAQIAMVETAYHVWAQPVPGKHAKPGQYDVAHSAAIYAIGRNGSERALYDDDDSVAALRKGVRELL